MEVGGNVNDRLPKEKDAEPRKEAGKNGNLAVAPQTAPNCGDGVEEMSTSEDSPLNIIINRDPRNSTATTTETDSSSAPVMMDSAATDVKQDEQNSEMKTFEGVIREAFRVIQSHKQEASVKSSINTLVMLLSAVQKNPQQLKTRKLRADMHAIKKFVMEINGALDFMKAVGFHETKSDKDFSYLFLEESAYDPRKFEFALSLLTAAPAQPKEEKKGPEGKKKCVVATCAFWGDENSDGYCSVCFKSKMTGQSPAAPPAAAIRCKCGFFGQKQFDNMCSKCYQKAGGAKKPPVVGNQWRKKLRRAILKLQAIRAFYSAPRLLQKNKTRCWQCNRKVGITGIDCKCGFVFCGTHRYADEHACRFDHKGNFQKTLRKQNQQVVSKKFDTID